MHEMGNKMVQQLFAMMVRLKLVPHVITEVSPDGVGYNSFDIANHDIFAEYCDRHQTAWLRARVADNSRLDYGDPN